MISFSSSAKFNKNVAIVLCDKEQVKRGRFPFTISAVKKAVAEIVAAKQFQGAEGELFPILHNKAVILLTGVGDRSKLTPTQLRILTRRAASSGYVRSAKTVEIVLHDQSDAAVTAVLEGLLIGTYRWTKYLTKPKEDTEISSKEYTIVTTRKKIHDEVVTVCQGVTLARNLINDNADVVTSEYFEKEIRRITKGKKNVSLEVLNRKEMKAKGLGLHLAVNQGSNKEPKLIIVKYHGAAKTGDYTAFIGKGMTYDTGGLNLKPTGHIETMKTDMSGAAAVVGTLANILSLGVKKNILFVVGLAENAIGKDAYKPGDVFKSYSGKTVEIGNTDAEGRLVLADAISYVVRNYKPKRIIDIATLTGACVVALGHDYTGLVSTDDDFARQIVRSSNETDDRVWRLPSYPELKDSVKSKIADIRNLGFPRGAGGTLTAAEFLRQFTEDTLWAHLDIAGTAYNESGDRLYFGHGATGAGVRLITHYLQHSA